MNKSDLKVGMMVECRDGWKGKVCYNGYIQGTSNRMTAMDFNWFNDDLVSIINKKDDIIMKVYDENEKLIWERGR